MADERMTERVSIWVTPEQKRRLDEMHRRTRVPSAELVREGIELMLAARAMELAERSEKLPKVMRKTDTPEARAFWAHAEQCAAEVATWPAWKRVGVDPPGENPERKDGAP